jgi:hypothetical protein
MKLSNQVICLFILMMLGGISCKMFLMDDFEEINNNVAVDVNWYHTGLKGLDVAIGINGETWAIGKNSKLYKYNLSHNTWELFTGDYDLPDKQKVAVDWEGRPWVIANSRNLYYLDDNNKWIEVGGCARDISIGKKGEIWKIGCDSRDGGYGVYKLNCLEYCGDDKNCGCGKKHKSIKNKITKNKCQWDRVDGAGIRIAIHPDGIPYVIKKDNTIWKLNSDLGIWIPIGGYLAIDLSISKEGLLLVSGIDYSVARVVCEATSTWVILNGHASAIAAGPLAQPGIVGPYGEILVSFNLGFN